MIKKDMHIIKKDIAQIKKEMPLIFPFLFKKSTCQTCNGTGRIEVTVNIPARWDQVVDLRKFPKAPYCGKPPLIQKTTYVTCKKCNGKGYKYYKYRPPKVVIYQ